MTPRERYLFVMANVAVPPSAEPTDVEIEILGWATDWPSVQLHLRIVRFFDAVFSRVAALEALVDPETLTAAIAAAQSSAAAAASSAAQALTEGASAAAASQAAAVQAANNALAAMGHAQAAASHIATLEARLAAAEERLATLESHPALVTP